ncbi:MAG: DUF4912 domain-containing protein [Planctomycetaceae bacterium]|nr:DUF4912 domain-containing protein [Planctomycetaceae bacterium]
MGEYTVLYGNEALSTRGHGTGVSPAAAKPRALDELRAHFIHKYPMLLDGTLVEHPSGASFLRQARETLANGKVDHTFLPAPILREALDQLSAIPAAPAGAGLVPINPTTARVWWDASLVDNLEDVLAQLDQPKAVLRFYDVTGLEPGDGRWHKSFDIDVDLAESGRTVPLWSSDRVYAVDLGYVHADGRFLRLARTNAVRLPREKTGEDDPTAVASSALRRHDGPDRSIVPDDAARDWAAARHDFPGRDYETELVIHMLYRAFLREGPRALRRAPRLIRRDDAVLVREFASRQHNRHRRLAQPAPSAVLIARLDDSPARLVASSCRYQPVLAVARVVPAVTPDFYAWCEALLQAARGEGVGIAKRPAALAQPAAVAEATPLVRRIEEGEAIDMPAEANPVFAAARTLRDNLEAMHPVMAGEADLDSELAAFSAEALTIAHSDKFAAKGSAFTPFGGVEAKRMAKAGVRITRMALTLEGRMRPGARLKVAGRLVHADAQGKFRLECVLTGKRASIPMRAGTSIEGEARSLINVDWEKRATSEKRKVYQ